MITPELKTRILSELATRRKNFAGSDVKFALSIGINNAQYSRIKNGDTHQVISDQSWISLARQFDIAIGNAPAWNVARTPVYDFITEQLEFCQKNASSRLFCDVAGIGKTFTAKQFIKTHRNAVYVDCSQVKTKQRLIKFIAKEFGVGYTGKYWDIYSDLVYYLRGIESPLIILDEAGDLDRLAFKEVKALWNATELCCGWYMMGADGLREKIRRSLEGKVVDYAEIFSRYGSRYQKSSPESSQELRQFKETLAALIIKANITKEVNIQKLIARSDYSLRRIADELRKIA